MARKSRKSKSGLTIDEEQVILHLKPENLAVEAAREGLAVETLKQQKKDDPKISQLTEQKKEFDDAVNAVSTVVEAQAKLDELKDAEKSTDHLKVEEDLKALRKGWGGDIRQRSKKLKFMMKTLKSHMEVGLLKSKVD